MVPPQSVDSPPAVQGRQQRAVCPGHWRRKCWGEGMVRGRCRRTLMLEIRGGLAPRLGLSLQAESAMKREWHRECWEDPSR